jgi:hypothetical protein
MSFVANPLRPTAAPTMSRGAPRSFGGWAFQRIAALDLLESPGLLAEIASRSALVRQAVFATISRLGEHNPLAFAHGLNASIVSGGAPARAGLANWSAQRSRSNASP